MSTFDLNPKLKRGIAAGLAVGVVAVGAASIAAGSGGNTAKPAGLPATPKARSAAAHPGTRSTVPASLTRAESAAEDVITYLLEHGKTSPSPPSPALARAEAKTLKQLVHGQVAVELTKAGVSQSKIRALQQRADHVAQLSRGGASKLRVSLAANHVSQLMPSFYARYQDPVPASVLRLDYINREMQLRSIAGQAGRVKRLVKADGSTWAKLRPQLVAAGGTKAARQYDAHLQALKQDKSPTAVQKQALKGLDIVDLMETAFLGK
jgi:hypothetical protein